MPESTAPNFIRDIIADDVAAGRNGGRVHTRFPPEPSGYLHIGHAKAIALDFGMADEFGGRCNLRFDDTNPTAEEVEYVESIKRDIRWLGYDWEDREYYASDYFEQLYQYAEQLVRKGLAYVDSQSSEEISAQRGGFKVPGTESPWRDRPPEESLDLLRRMRAGQLEEGSCVLRARIDMASPNMNLRDPVMYRILRAPHHRTGTDWCIYPTYDWAHGQSDAIEGITHSLCTLEFENHRPLYDWFVEHIDGLPSRPRQIEFARLNLSYTVMSKRLLKELVEDGLVKGWDDPRLPTLSGLRRRGYSPAAIRAFAERIGVAKRDGVVDVSLLEHALREDLNAHSPRVMAVLDPLEVVITNLPEGETLWFDAPYHPEDPSAGTRRVPLSRRVLVERQDFREDPPRKWRRLAPGWEVRLRYACLVTCQEVVVDEQGRVVQLRCTWDPDSRGGDAPDGRRVKGTLHWVSAEHAVECEVRLYDRLFRVADPLADEDWKQHLNPDSLEVLSGCMAEPSLAGAEPLHRVQLERLGYFCVDPDSTAGRPVLNRTITLRDSWAAIERRQAREAAERARAEKKAKKKARKKKDAAPGVIQYGDFAKLDLRVGVVHSVEEVEGADRLLRLLVDLGEERPRQVLAGVREVYPDPSVLVGERVIVVANLAPRKMRFGVSEAMLLAAGAGTDRLALATLSDAFEPGDRLS